MIMWLALVLALLGSALAAVPPQMQPPSVSQYSSFFLVSWETVALPDISYELSRDSNTIYAGNSTSVAISRLGTALRVRAVNAEGSGPWSQAYVNPDAGGSKCLGGAGAGGQDGGETKQTNNKKRLIARCCLFFLPYPPPLSFLSSL